MSTACKVYAVYKQDKFITLGTARECAEYMGIKISSFRYYCRPCYKRRNVSGRRYEIIEMEE